MAILMSLIVISMAIAMVASVLVAAVAWRFAVAGRAAPVTIPEHLVFMPDDLEAGRQLHAFSHPVYWTLRQTDDRTAAEADAVVMGTIRPLVSVGPLRRIVEGFHSTDGHERFQDPVDSVLGHVRELLYEPGMQLGCRQRPGSAGQKLHQCPALGRYPTALLAQLFQCFVGSHSLGRPSRWQNRSNTKRRYYYNSQ